MAGYIEDRWFKKGPPRPDDEKKRPTRVKTARHGQGKRWRVAGIPGVRDRSFTHLKGPGGAEEWLAEAQTDTKRGEFYDPRDGDITLREYVEQHWWPNLRKPPGTKQSMQPRVFKHILPHVGHLSLNRIGHDEVLRWQTAAEKNIDVSTLTVTWRHFSSIMQAAYKARRIPANPFRDEDLKAPTVPKSKAKAWTPQTVTAMRAVLPDRYSILMDLGIAAGLRQGEAFAFSPDDIDGAEINVVRQVVRINSRLGFAPPKGNKERVAPCPPALARAVREYTKRFPTVEVTLPWVDPDRPNLAWEDRPLRTVRLLVTTIRTAGKSGGAMNRTYFDDHVWKPALLEAGLIPPPVVEVVERPGRAPLKRVRWGMPREEGFHVTRHTFASIVLQAGETVTQLAAWLGHSDPAFTLRTYVHFMPKSGSMGLAALGEWVAADGAGAAEISVASDSPQILPSARSPMDSEAVPAGQ